MLIAVIAKELSTIVLMRILITTQTADCSKVIEKAINQIQTTHDSIKNTKNFQIADTLKY